MAPTLHTRGPQDVIELLYARRSTLSRSRLQWALATSLAAAWIHICNGAPLRTSAQSISLRPRAISPDPGGVHTQRQRGPVVSVAGASLLRNETPRSRTSWHARQRHRGVRLASTSVEVRETASPPPPPPFPASSDASNGRPSRDGETRDLNNKSGLTDLNKARDINTLMRHPVLLDNVKAPRHPIVLCHGLYGFNVRGPFWGLEIHYWATVLDILRKKIGAEVIVRGVPGTGAIADRAQALHDYLKSPEAGVRGKPLNFVSHSMGGLDARYLISILQPAPEEYIPISLTTLNAPHRGSPFMDWCNANVGTGNERVEKEIREARSKGLPRMSTDGAKSARSTQSETSAQHAQVEEDFTKHVVEKPPFSLKTPIFVMPSKGGTKAEAKEDQVKNMAKGAAAMVAEEAAATTGQENYEAAKKRGGGNSLLDFSAFKRALSSMSGTFSKYMLSILDQPAYAMLSTRYMAYVFNPMVVDSPNVEYFSIASRKKSLPVYHPLWLPKQILDAAAVSRSLGGERDGSGDAVGSRLEGNDGLVSVESAKWGNFLGVVDGCDHWDLRGGGAPRWATKASQAADKKVQEQANVENAKAAKEQDTSDKEKEENSWIDVNRIIGKLANARGADKDARDRTKSSSSDEKGDDGANAMVNEVATWISERLPQGKGEADAFERSKKETMQGSAASQAASSPKPTHSPMTYSITSSDNPSSQPSPPSATVNHAYVPTSDELGDMRVRVQLRREAAWQEELGHDERAHELRRDLAWHEEDVRRRAAMVNFASHQQHSSKSEAKDGNTLKKADDLELFWIAVCRHLWSRGY